MKKTTAPLDFKGKVALVTGAGTGIGEAIALKLGALGAKVMCVGLPGDPVEDVAASIQKLGSPASYFEADISDGASAKSSIEHTLKKFGKLDIVCCNAGVVLAADNLEETSDEAFERTVRNNIFTMFYTARAAIPALKKTRGVIVATGSVAGLKGEPGDVVYGGTKGFVHAFMQGLAIEQAPHGIRVNCVLPGVTDTAMTRAARTAISKKEEQTMTDNIPMRRRGTVEEIANVVAFLASDLASYMTGSLVTVDGGYSTSWGDADEVPSSIRRRPKGSLDGLLKHTLKGGFKKNNPEPAPRRY